MAVVGRTLLPHRHIGVMLVMQPGLLTAVGSTPATSIKCFMEDNKKEENMETGEKNKIIDYDRLKQYNELKNQEIDDKLQKYVFTDGSDKPSTEVIPTDADTLKGHGVEYFATAEELTSESARAKAEEKAISDALQGHLTDAASHSDIRESIRQVATRLNTLADSDDETLDQLSEIVSYIKNNKSLIDGVTTSKVNVSDIVDDLTSTAIDKPLSANQGKALKLLISALTERVDGMPTFEIKDNDSGGQTLVIK